MSYVFDTNILVEEYLCMYSEDYSRRSSGHCSRFMRFMNRIMEGELLMSDVGVREFALVLGLATCWEPAGTGGGLVTNDCVVQAQLPSGTLTASITLLARA